MDAAPRATEVPPEDPTTGRKRRTQAERSAETQARILAAARTAFAREGYAATSIEQILFAAGVTRGALYHHFDDKKDLFRAVLLAVYQEVAHHVLQGSETATDPWDSLIAGFDAFFDIVQRQDVLRIFYTEACAVLDYPEWSRIDREHGSAVFERFLTRAVDAGVLAPLPQPCFALMLMGAIDYAMDWAIEADVPARLADVRASFVAILEGLRITR